MKVILDANVFVSAAIQRGASYRIVQNWLGGSADFEVVMCPQLLGEVRYVLTTWTRLRKWIDLDSATSFVETINALVDLTRDPVPIGKSTRDADDDYLIALAREHDVDLIVSGDKDLLEWGEQRPSVVTPAAFDAEHSL